MIPHSYVTEVREHLRMVIGECGESVPDYEYAFALIPRYEDNWDFFGIITSGGESLPLTGRLLSGLRNTTCAILGIASAEISEHGENTPGMEFEHDIDLPVDALKMVFFDYSSEEVRMDLITEIWTPTTLDRPLTILTPHRPAGWPL